MQILDFQVVTWKFTNFLLLLYFDIFYFFTFDLKKKLICCFKTDKNLMNFKMSIRNSQDFHLDLFLLCKVYNVWQI